MKDERPRDRRRRERGKRERGEAGDRDDRGARAGHVQADEHGPRAARSQPRFDRGAALRREAETAACALEDRAPERPEEHELQRHTDRDRDGHGDRELADAVFAEGGLRARADHQEVARDRHWNPDLLEEKDDEDRRESVRAIQEDLALG